MLVLRTPGGLLDSTRTMVSRMITSRAPVVVFVGPSGARAASAGFILLIAADVAAMAPGHACWRGASRLRLGREDGRDHLTESRSDAAAYVRTLAEARGRNVSLAADAVLQSRAFTDREALEAMPPLIDLSAKDVDDLLRQLEGRTIKRFDGRSTTVHTRDAEVRRVEMTRRQRFLSAIAHPQVSYILMTLGLLGLTVELWNPGLIAPGVVGGALPPAGVLRVSDPAREHGGAAARRLRHRAARARAEGAQLRGAGCGRRGEPHSRLGDVDRRRARRSRRPRGHPARGVGFAVVFLFLGRLALRAQMRPAVTGAQTLVGQLARVRTPLLPREPGLVDMRGEIWRAVSPVPCRRVTRFASHALMASR